MLGQALGLPTTMTAFAFIGVAVTSATMVVFGEAIWDPVVLITRIGSPLVIIVSAIIVLAAQLTTNMAANVVSPANDFASLAPKKIGYVAGGLITAVLGIVMMPWKLYADAAAYIFTWLIGYSSLMGAVGGILIADYWILRKRQLSLPDLFKLDGRYSYGRGTNRAAMIALVVSILPVIPGFARAAMTPGGAVSNPSIFDHLYTYAWFVTFALSAAIYLALMRRSRAKHEEHEGAKTNICVFFVSFVFRSRRHEYRVLHQRQVASTRLRQDQQEHQSRRHQRCNRRVSADDLGGCARRDRCGRQGLSRVEEDSRARAWPRVVARGQHRP